MSVKTDFLSCKIIMKNFSFMLFLPFMQWQQSCNFECLNDFTVKSHQDSEVLSLLRRASRRCCRLVPEFEEILTVWFVFFEAAALNTVGVLYSHAQNTVAGTHIQAYTVICIRTFIHSMKLYCTCPQTQYHIFLFLWGTKQTNRLKQLVKTTFNSHFLWVIFTFCQDTIKAFTDTTDVWYLPMCIMKHFNN